LSATLAGIRLESIDVKLDPNFTPYRFEYHGALTYSDQDAESELLLTTRAGQSVEVAVDMSGVNAEKRGDRWFLVWDGRSGVCDVSISVDITVDGKRYNVLYDLFINLTYTGT